MRKVQIIYNPFYITTKILVDGKTPKVNSSLNFSEEKRRLTEWAEELPLKLREEYSDANYEIDFIGSEADFIELKEAFSSHSGIINAKFHHAKVMPPIDVVEAKVLEIYKEISRGPLQQLKHESIKIAFANAQNRKLEIGIVAAVSAGKSTLINALLGRKLMPVAHKATTATIVRIVHKNQDNYHAIAYDEKHHVIADYKDVSRQQMKMLNDDVRVLEIVIEGRIPCVASVGMELVLLDTPGPNNARNMQHKMITKRLLKNPETHPSLVLFVLNATNLNTTDESGILDFVSQSMAEGNKHSRDRYIFALNKMDLFNPEDDSVEETLVVATDELSKRNILAPNIFPVSAQVAFENRSHIQDPMALPLYLSRYKEDASVHFDKYYGFSHLPLSVKKSLESKLNCGNEETIIDIHSGIVSIEEAIKLYVNKYARTIKIRDLVESFNRNLKSLAVAAQIAGDIDSKKGYLSELDALIRDLEKNVSSGEAAKKLSDKLEEWDFTSDARKKIQNRFAEAIKELSSIDIAGKSNKVDKSSAKKMCDDLDNKLSNFMSSLVVDIETMMMDSFQTSLDKIKKEFIDYIEQLNAGIDSSLVSMGDFDFQLDKMFDADSIFSENTKGYSEDYYVEVKKTRKVPGNRLQNAQKTMMVGGLASLKASLGNPLIALIGGAASFVVGYIVGDGDREETNTEHERRTRIVDYVDVVSIVDKCKENVKKDLGKATADTLKYLDEEAENLRSSVKAKVTEIDKAIKEKIEFLKSLFNEKKSTNNEIQSLKANLEWLKKMKKKVDELIEY